VGIYKFLDKDIKWNAITENDFNNIINAFNPDNLDYQLYSAITKESKDCELILILGRKFIGRKSNK